MSAESAATSSDVLAHAVRQIEKNLPGMPVADWCIVPLGPLFVLLDHAKEALRDGD